MSLFDICSVFTMHFNTISFKFFFNTALVNLFVLQLGIDIGSSTVARGVVGLVLGYLNNLVIEMAFLIQVSVGFLWKNSCLCLFSYITIDEAYSMCCLAQ